MQWTFDRVTVEKEKCNEKEVCLEDVMLRIVLAYCTCISTLIWKTKIYEGQVGRHIEISLKHSLWYSVSIFKRLVNIKDKSFSGTTYQLIALENQRN